MIDPVLFDKYGNGPNDMLYPAIHKGQVRHVDFSKLPRMNALIITHEHEDHFDIKSLNCFSRKIKIYISANSSIALESILKEMGFSKIVKIVPNKIFAIGDLELTGLTPPKQLALIDEWDVIPLLITNKNKDISFFYTVDRVSLFFEKDYPPSYLMPKIKTKSILVNTEGIFHHLPTKDIYTFDFRKRSAQFLAYGAKISFKKDSVLKVNELNTFSSIQKVTKVALKKKIFTSKQKFPKMNQKEWSHLEKRLNSLASDLYATPLFMKLLNLRAVDPEKSFYFLILDGSKTVAYKYCLISANFIKIQKRKKYFASCMCHGKDLLKVLDGQIEPRVLNLNRSHWHCHPELGIPLFLSSHLWQVLHPLKQPALAYRRYQTRLKRIRHEKSPVFL